MARRGETCGAVTGAMLVIGLKHGKTRPDDDEARERTYKLVAELVSRFKSRNRTVLCRELLGHDFGTPEGIEAIQRKKLITTLCPKFVRDAAEIVEEILLTDRE